MDIVATVAKCTRVAKPASAPAAAPKTAAAAAAASAAYPATIPTATAAPGLGAINSMLDGTPTVTALAEDGSSSMAALAQCHDECFGATKTRSRNVIGVF